MTSFLQLIYPGVIATGNSERVDILRDADVADDNNVVRLARIFAQGEGLVLYRYQRAGMEPAIPEDWPESTRAVINSARDLLGPKSHEIYTLPGTDELPDAPRSDPGLGPCSIAQAGVSLQTEEAVLEFVRRRATVE